MLYLFFVLNAPIKQGIGRFHPTDAFICSIRFVTCRLVVFLGATGWKALLVSKIKCKAAENTTVKVDANTVFYVEERITFLEAI